MCPGSVAVVGATERPGSYAGQAMLNLETIGFAGPVWGVNPGRDTVYGRPCVATVAELPVAVDALVVAIPAAGVAAVIDQAGARGCGGAVVFSAGFDEVRGGRERSRELVEAAARYGLPVCGPNCNGIVSPGARIALWGDALARREPGAVALVSQSGNVAVNALATMRGLRFHTVVASGNQGVLGAADYLEFLAHEEGVDSIALYLEDDGGPELCDALATCAEASLPVVVLKVGSSPAGARAAVAHSGALARDQRVFASLVAEAGAVWAHDVHELLEMAKTLAVSPRSGPGHEPGQRPRGLAIMTCSGGDSAQGADEAQQLGLQLPELAPVTMKRLRALLPSAATVANPLDYTTMIWGQREPLAELVRVLGEDPEIGQVVVFYDQPRGLTGDAQESWRAVREAVIAGAAQSPVPTLVSSTLPELLDDEAAWGFAQAGVAAAAGLRTGLRCAAAALRDAGAAPARLREIARTARAARDRNAPAGEWLPEHAAKALLRASGIDVPPGRVAGSEDDAVAAWHELAGPVALKLSAADVQHKSELDGVVLAIGTEGDVRRAYRRLSGLAEAHGGSVLVERMTAAGAELIVAAHTAGVVPALVLGLGGIYAEVLDDVVVLPLPADADRVKVALRALRGASLIWGARGRPGIDVDAVARLAQRLGELLVAGSLQTLECNPVLAGAPGQGAVAVDATIRLGTAGGAGADA